MSTDSELNLLVLTDLHHAAGAGYTFPYKDRRRMSGPLLLRKALQRLKFEGVKPDALALLGDVAGKESHGNAEPVLAEMAEAVRATGLPVLAVPGNHDGDPALYARLFNCQPGIHAIGGYGFLLFADPYAADESTTRTAGGLQLPAEAAAARPDMPLIALQHNPLHPVIDEDYPYLPRNAADICASYERAGVILSLSGHYHDGQAVHEQGGVLYGTAPAACDSPYTFLHVRLRGRRAEVREHALRVSVPGLIDSHCHTEYSYCGKDVNAADDVALSAMLGVERLCLVDHTFQLYFDKDDAWSWRWQMDRAMVERAWAGGRGRMPEYRRRAESLRSETVRVGLEIDLLDDGSLLLAEEDRAGWDVLIGAVHALRGSPKYGSSQAEVESLFMRDTERLLQHPIDVLAHPFRYFRRSGLTHPTHLHKRVAGMLASAGVAAEINYHINQPNLQFLEECLARGVKLSLATDSHDSAEVGELAPHLKTLRAVGVRDEDVPRVMFQPR
jgi:histidinol phosphatase-like PHP family hydrolase